MVLIHILILLILSSIYCSSVDEIKHLMQSLYGENKEITGEYDTSLSIECNNGIFVGTKNQNVHSFKGIPYAKPPINDLRWKEPVLAEDSQKVFQAFYFGKSPIQSEWETQYGSYYPQSEDSLYLNIWLNSKDTSNNKTVIVFVHGGSYGWGATNDPLYNGNNLVDKYQDIIFISVEYRLGIFGFIDFSTVPGGENYKSSGNLGILDVICALKWIKKNIEKFGGDPNNVTLMGQSSGASIISLIPLVEGSDGLFKRIICESGSLSLTFSKKETQKLTQKLLEKSKAKNMDDLLKLSEKELIEINNAISNYDNYAERDGNVLPIDLYNAYNSEKGKNIDMLLGSNADEVNYFKKSFDYYIDFISGNFLFKHAIPIMYENNYKIMSKEDKEIADEFMNFLNQSKVEKITEFYNEMIFRLPMNKLAEYHSEAGGNTYVYLWKYPGENKNLGACHNIELSYTLNNLNITLYTGNKVSQELADNVQDLWINFARTGNPSTSKITWDKYDTDKRKTIILDEKIEMIEDYKGEQREILDPLLKYYFNGNYVQLSLNVPQTYKIVAQVLGGLLLSILIISIFTKMIFWGFL